MNKITFLFLSLLISSTAFSIGFTGLKNIHSNDCLEYFEKGKVLHKYAILGEESGKQKVAFVYDEELFEMIFYPKEQTYKDKTYAFQFVCYKLTE